MTQADQNQNFLDHPQGNTHNDYQNTLASVVIPNQHQQVTTQQEQNKPFFPASYFLKAFIYYNHCTSINFESI